MLRRKHPKGEKHFHKLSIHVSDILGSMWAFVFTVGLVSISGLYFQFSSGWESHVGFIVALLTFIFLFILQKFQNVENKAIHLKLDEIIRSLKDASNEVMQAEEKTEEEIDQLKIELIEHTFGS